MVLFFRAVTQQALDREHNNIPDLESYITLRRNTSGCKPCFALIEHAACIDLPDMVMQHPSIGILENATNDLVTWTNVRFCPSCSFSLCVDPCVCLSGYLLLQRRAVSR